MDAVDVGYLLVGGIVAAFAVQRVIDRRSHPRTWTHYLLLHLPFAVALCLLGTLLRVLTLSSSSSAGVLASVLVWFWFRDLRPWRRARGE